MWGRWSEWQCAGILCQSILRRKKKTFSLLLPAEKKKIKLKIAEEENSLEPEKVHVRHVDL